MTEAATLDSLIYGKQQLVSYRHLSALLSIPSRRAQSILHSYLTSQPANSLRTIWCTSTLQNSVYRTSLSESPPKKPTTAHIWAIGPSTKTPIETTTAILFQDRLQEIQQATANTTATNHLRDGRFNRIQSSTAQWTPSTSVDIPTPSSRPSSSSKPSALLAVAKAKASAQESKASIKRKSKSKLPSKKISEPKNPDSLFSSRSLGSASTARLKKTEDVPVKKARRVVDDESDDEEHDENLKAMEKEAAENEAAEVERQAEKEELLREVAELTRKHEEQEPESPEIKDIEQKHSDPDSILLSPRKPDSAKRKFIDTFGGLQGAGRKLKKVTITRKDDKGYVITETVEKWVDADGNELPDPPKSEEIVTPPVKKMPNPESDGNGPVKSLQNKAKSAAGKSGSLKKKSVGSARKKVKGNIMSYFGKKS